MLVELTFDKAKQLRRGDVLYQTKYKNADGTPRRWKVNGAVQLWVKDPSRIRVPLKHGLRGYDAITETDFVNGICSSLSIEEQD